MKTLHNYITKNRYPYDCQVVTAVNAYTYLTGKTIPDKKRYKKFLALVSCNYGGSMFPERLWKRLGIRIKRTFDWYGTDIDNSYLPFEARISHPNYGNHSVLVVDIDKKTKTCLVLNFLYGTSSDGWVFIEDFTKYILPMGWEKCGCKKGAQRFTIVKPRLRQFELITKEPNA